MVRGTGFEPANPYGTSPSNIPTDKVLEEFKKFCEVDRRLKPGTIKEHLRKLMQLQEAVSKPLCELTHDDLRDYLAQFKDAGPYHYANILKALRVFYIHFIGTNIAEGFKFPQFPFVPKHVPTHEQLRKFYRAIKPQGEARKYPISCHRALFLLYATTGRRRGEILNLILADLDMKLQMLRPNGGTRTKQVWVAFWNFEADRELRKYLRWLKPEGGDTLIFPTKSQIDRVFDDAAARSGVKITPKVLRVWFCCEMGRLGVQDRYIDALCGRVPSSVLARHYTDFSPERLKEIYDKAGLKVLG